MLEYFPPVLEGLANVAWRVVGDTVTTAREVTSTRSPNVLAEQSHSGAPYTFLQQRSYFFEQTRRQVHFADLKHGLRGHEMLNDGLGDAVRLRGHRRPRHSSRTRHFHKRTQTDTL